MPEALISIIVPVYNVEPYLPACLDSLLAQTQENWECLLIDDGSPDRSGEICEEYAARDSRFRVIHQHNSGVAVARNVGLDNIRGEYVVFIDGDDAVAPDYLKTLLNLLTLPAIPAGGRKDISVIGFSRFSGAVPSKDKSVGPAGCLSWSPQEAALQLLYQTGLLDSSPWGKMYRAHLFDDLRFTPGIIYEDLDLMYRLFLKASGICGTRDVQYFYRQNPESLTSIPSPRRIDAVSVCERIVDYAKKHCPPLLPAAEDRLLSASFNMLGLMAAYPGILDSHKERCERHIKTLSRRSLLNKKVRLKNKLGILLYYAPLRPLFRLLARRLYR